MSSLQLYYVLYSFVYIEKWSWKSQLNYHKFISLLKTGKLKESKSPY